MRVDILRLFGFLFVLFFATVAVAQEDIQSLNKMGLDAFSEGHYVEAAELFGRAYAIQPRAELLKNRAVSLYRADRCHEALPVATTFLENEITVAEHKQISSLKDGCYVILAEKAILAEDYILARTLVGKANEQPALIDRITSINNAILDVEILLPRRSVSSRPGAFVQLTPNKPIVVESGPAVIGPDQSNTAAWLLMGLGATILAGTTVYFVHSKFSIEPEFRRVAKSASSRSRYNELDNQLRVANWLVPTLYAAGVATAGSGLTLFFFPGENETGITGVAWRASF